jgi:methionine synthase II (cobalamin-independent)
LKRSETRILTTHVGSLIRPPELVEIGKAVHGDVSNQSPGGATAERRYRGALERATVDVVRRQVDAGIDIVNDGEYGKSSWSNYVLERLTGFEPRSDRLFEAVWLGRDRIRFREFMQVEFPRAVTGSSGHVCVGPISYRGHESIQRNVADAKAAFAAAAVSEGFLTAVAPASTGYVAANEYYATDRDYVFAIVNEELGAGGAWAVAGAWAAVAAGAALAARAAGGDERRRAVADACTAALLAPAALHIAVCRGWIPIVGVTMPFLSYDPALTVASGGEIGVLVALALAAQAPARTTTDAAVGLVT